MIEPERLREIEPHAAGIRAIWSPTTAIVDYTEVSEAMARRAPAARRRDRARRRRDEHRARPATAWISGRRAAPCSRNALINCAGLYSDVVARMAGAKPDVQIMPFRGEYYMVRPDRRHLVRTLIYPVPDPEFPFLGVHFTNTVHGEVEAGPNAVLAFAREGYTFWRVRPSELGQTLTYPASGTWRGSTGGRAATRCIARCRRTHSCRHCSGSSPRSCRMTSTRAAPGSAPRPSRPTARSSTISAIVGDDTGDPRAQRAVARRHRVASHRASHRGVWRESALV